jgi:type II secretory pathway component GspD/PulD (secretin)
MKRSFKLGIFFSLSCLFMAGTVYGQFISKPGEKSIPEKENVRIYVTNRPLEEVLQYIANQTGIRFKISNSLTSKMITANIQASDWESAVMELLKGFSKIEVWTSDLNSTRIHLLQSNDYLALNETASHSREPSNIKKQAVVAQAPQRKKPAWKCFSLSGKRKC